MAEEFDKLSIEEKLKAENELLKIKMMLENGAKFGEGGEKASPEIENEFLNYIKAFERQAANPKYIKLYDKLRRPVHFIPVAEIPDNEIEGAWESLSDYMRNYGISLDVFSPNVSARELCRFTTEELFNEQMNDMDVPGMMSCYTYDDFYPDPYFDNTQAATEDCIKCILEKMPMKWTPHFRCNNLRLNNHFSLKEEELKIVVNRYKETFDNIEIVELEATDCTVDGSECQVVGIYKVAATSANVTIHLSGNWYVDFEKDDDFSYWYIYSVKIEGISF